jgi:putative hydrolase of the HAD superfamily
MNLVFDFGAVLFAWQPAQLVAAYFPKQATTPAEAAQLAQSVFGHADWHEFDRGCLSLDAVVDRTAERLSLPMAPLQALIAGIADGLQPINAMVSVLAALSLRRQLRGDLRLYYLSNMPEPYARTLERKHDFVQWFDGGIFSGDVLRCKPDPAIYQLLQTRHALAPDQTVFIDDLQTNVDAACALGWHGIHFVSAPQLQRSLANLLGQ